MGSLKKFGTTLMLTKSLNLLVLGLLIALSSTSMAQDFRGMKIVHLLQEPRHRTVHIDGDVYLLDVQVNAGDTSFPHVHDAAIMITFISNGEGPAGGRVSGNIDYVEQNHTHSISNSGPNLLRILAMTNYGPGLPNLMSDRPTGITAEPQYENAWFRSYRITLQPGEETAMQTHANPSAVIQVSAGKVHISRADGITEELSAIADWAWRDARGAFSIKNAGSEAVDVVVNEARR